MTTETTLDPRLAKPARRRSTASSELAAFKAICEGLSKVPADRRLAVITAAAALLGVSLK